MIKFINLQDVVFSAAPAEASTARHLGLIQPIATGAARLCVKKTAPFSARCRPHPAAKQMNRVAGWFSFSKTKTLAAFLLISGAVSAVERPEALGHRLEEEKLVRLIPALVQVESNGRNVYGDGGMAGGILQIWPCVVEDVNRITGKQYTLADRFDRVKSVEICRAYLGHYAKGKSAEQAARIWNGGPQGDHKVATLAYWKKVKKQLESSKG